MAVPAQDGKRQVMLIWSGRQAGLFAQSSVLSTHYLSVDPEQLTPVGIVISLRTRRVTATNLAVPTNNIEVVLKPLLHRIDVTSWLLFNSHFK
jgi:hypothetical protein